MQLVLVSRAVFAPPRIPHDNLTLLDDLTGWWHSRENAAVAIVVPGPDAALPPRTGRLRAAMTAALSVARREAAGSVVPAAHAGLRVADEDAEKRDAGTDHARAAFHVAPDEEVDVFVWDVVS